MQMRNCPFCGRKIGAFLTSCPYCREAMPEASGVSTRVNAVRTFQGRVYMRRGFLYALLAGVVYFFAAGYSGMNLPFPVPDFVSTLLIPLLFVAGIGMMLYGGFLYLRA